jgi:hypothetical protein
MHHFLLLLTILLFTCCSRTYDQNGQLSYHDNGTKKPLASLAPVFDHARSDCEWSLSEELSDMIEQKLLQEQKIYLTQDFKPIANNKEGQKNMHIFLDSTDWIKEMQTNSEFVIFVELLKHDLAPSNSDHHLLSSATKKSYNLDVSLRIKVIDLRQNKARVILQEILHQSFYIPFEYSRVAYKKDPWTRAMFSLSPIGMAHVQIVKKICAQIQDYILLAKTQ